VDGGGEGAARLRVLRLQPVYPLETTVAGFNIDALSPTGPARDVLVIGYGQSELEDRLERVLAANGRVVARDRSPEAGYFYRSDHFPMAKRGVPMLYVDSGEDLVSGGRAAGEAAARAYTRDRYHQPADEFDAATWSFEGIAQDALVLHRWGCSSPTRATGPTTAPAPSSGPRATRRRRGGSSPTAISHRDAEGYRKETKEHQKVLLLSCGSLCGSV
jgi:Zn-dependent M28 family amino/carboxypeptidase